MNDIKYADCIFLAKSEWNLIEMTLPDKFLAKYAQEDYPTVDYEGETFAYMPVAINGRTLRALRGNRPHILTYNVAGNSDILGEK